MGLFEIIQEHTASNHLGALLVEHHSLIDLVDRSGSNLVGVDNRFRKQGVKNLEEVRQGHPHRLVRLPNW